MPLYDYECCGCGKVQEVEASIRETEEQVAARLTCSCGRGGATLGLDPPHFKRLITGSNFSLKGQGWSRDGYR